MNPFIHTPLTRIKKKCQDFLKWIDFEIPPHSLYKKPQSLISEGPELWVDSILSPWRTVVMLSPKQLQREGGGCHASATGATGPGDSGDKRLGDDHRARRRCGPAHWADGEDGLAGGLGPAYPAPLDATGAQLGVDSGDLAGGYRHGRRPPESIGGNLPQGHAPHPEPPDRAGHRAAGF